MPQFDITPAKATPKRVAVKRAAPPPVKRAGTPRPLIRHASSGNRRPAGVIPLKARRRARKKRLALLILTALLVLGGAALAILWQAPLRVTQVNASGSHESEMPDFVRANLRGTIYGVFPRNSIFFIPRDELRVAILAAYPDIDAVSLTPTGLTELSVSATPRARAFWWCGTTYAALPESCYETDATGKIFKQVAAEASASSSPREGNGEAGSPLLLSSSTPFIVFGAYQGGSETSPAGGIIGSAAKLPDLFRFVKALKELGANVTSAQIRDDEADLYTGGGTRITYVLGREKEALTLAATAFPNLDVGGNSLLYIDLRFASKIYYKKRGASE